MHVYDQPGSQLDEAVAAVAKAFKWRKSYGVENLDDSALNRFFLSKLEKLKKVEKLRKSYGVENLDDSALNRFFSIKIRKAKKM